MNALTSKSVKSSAADTEEEKVTGEMDEVVLAGEGREWLR